MTDHPEIGALPLECRDMPPYAKQIQDATGLPVWDYVTLIDWIYFSVVRRTYDGFIYVLGRADQRRIDALGIRVGPAGSACPSVITMGTRCRNSLGIAAFRATRKSTTMGIARSAAT